MSPSTRSEPSELGAEWGTSVLVDGSLLLIRRSRVRDPAGSYTYTLPAEGVRGEVREPAAPIRPLGVPGVAAAAFGAAA